MPTRALMLLRVLKLGVNIKKPDDPRSRRRVCSYADFKATAKELELDHRDESIQQPPAGNVLRCGRS